MSASRLLLGAIAALPFTALPLAAHDLYLRLHNYQPAAGQRVQVDFFNGDNFLVSQGAMKVERLRDLQLRSAAGTSGFTNFRADATMTSADVTAPSAPGLFVVSLHTQPNFIELAPAKFESYLKHEGLDAIIAWRAQNGEAQKPGRETYSKHVKAIAYTGAPKGAFDQPVGLAVEFVPLANPYTLKAGQPLPVRLLFRGQPRAGQAVELSHAVGGKVMAQKMLGRTNERGEIDVPTGGGLWKIHTVVMERVTGGNSDWESFWTSLTWELPAAR